jgi:hypothetical protein
MNIETDKDYYLSLYDKDLQDLLNSGELSQEQSDFVKEILSNRSKHLPESNNYVYLTNKSIFVNILRYWNGNAPLRYAFWYIHFLGVVLIRIAGKLLESSESFLILSSFTVFGIIYYIFTVVSVWRCSLNVTKKYWGYVARTFVILPLVLFNVFFMLAVIA